MDERGTEWKRHRFHGMYACAGWRGPISGAAVAFVGDRVSG